MMKSMMASNQFLLHEDIYGLVVTASAMKFYANCGSVVRFPQTHYFVSQKII